MTILNSYVLGRASQDGLFILCSAIGAAIIILSAIYIVSKLLEIKITIGEASICVSLSILVALIVYLMIFQMPILLEDTRTPRVEALINDNISFIEVNNTYELVEQKGSIYVFDVRKGTSEYDRLIAEGEQQ